MGEAVAVCHGSFGRVVLYRITRPMIRHVHREAHLIFWVGGGGGACHVGAAPEETGGAGTRCEIGPGSAVAISPWEVHDYEPDGGEFGQRTLVLYIRPGWFARQPGAPALPLRFGRPRIAMAPPLAALAFRAASLLAEGGGAEALGGLLFELARASLVQSHGLAPGGEAQRTAGFLDFRLRRSIRHMATNVGRPMGLDELAQHAGLSRPHFFKLFRDQVGVTPGLFWNTMRMERALGELAETPKSITEIGLDLGFSSQSSFSRFFVLNTGLAPSDYRRVARIVGN